MPQNRKIRSVLKSFMPVASQPQQIVRDGEQVPTPPPMRFMGDRLNGAIAIANLKRKQQNKAQHKVRTVESKIYSAIGQVIGDAAELKKVSPIQLLGLAEYVAEVLEQPEVQLEISQRGLAIYEAKYARAKTLNMLGTAGDKELAEALRAAGFVRVSGQWAGPANIVQAISIAVQHQLTLVRHEGHEVICYIKKGVPQPALVDLEAEHAAMVAEVTAMLAAASGEEAAEVPAMPESPDAALPITDRKSAPTVEKAAPGHGEPETKLQDTGSEAVASAGGEVAEKPAMPESPDAALPITDWKSVPTLEKADPEPGGPETMLQDTGSEAVAFAGRPRMGFNKGTMVRSASTLANTDKDA